MFFILSCITLTIDTTFSWRKFKREYKGMARICWRIHITLGHPCNTYIKSQYEKRSPHWQAIKWLLWIFGETFRAMAVDWNVFPNIRVLIYIFRLCWFSAVMLGHHVQPRHSMTSTVQFLYLSVENLFSHGHNMYCIVHLHTALCSMPWTCFGTKCSMMMWESFWVWIQPM